MPARCGRSMQTASGAPFWPLDPRPEDVSIEDIAHALSFQCRFAGHCRVFYSVAEHSVRVARVVEGRNAPQRVVLAALLHDAAEAYLGDMIRPLKPYMDSYRAAEDGVYSAIARRFGIPEEISWAVRGADGVLLATEARDLMGGAHTKWGLRHKPLAEAIEPWSSRRAKEEFLHMFEEVKGDV